MTDQPDVRNLSPADYETAKRALLAWRPGPAATPPNAANLTDEEYAAAKFKLIRNHSF